MYTGFDLRLDKNADIFGGSLNYERLQKIGENHLKNQKEIFEQMLKSYVVEDVIDGTKIQNEWFPQIEADIFISHSGKDGELTNALAGWIYKTFGLRCFIDGNVWGYSKTLLEQMNSKLSNKREVSDGGYLYDHESCNQVSQHVNMMLSIALQKMIDKVETIIILNTDNVVKVCSDTQMEKTYSPWIYAEISCTQFVRKKPLLAYRNYSTISKVYSCVTESVQFAMHSAISYTVSLKHLKSLSADDLNKWEWRCDSKDYEYKMDALYDIVCPGEVEKTKNLFSILENRELKMLQQAYSTRNMNSDEYETMQCVLESIIDRGLLCYLDCDNLRNVLNEKYE